MMRLEDKVALITGGGSGMGEAVARLFASEGASVVVTGRRPDPLHHIADEVGGLAVVGDTADPEHIRDVVESTTNTFGGVDILVAAAGISPPGSVGDVDQDDWRRCIRTNLEGPMLMAQAVLPSMQARGGGSMILVSSTAALAATPASVAYDVSKAGLLALARAIAVDYGSSGIRANTLIPGWVRTPMADRSMDALAADRGITRDGAYATATEQVPLRRPGTPTEMASCCLFLASDESAYVSGSMLVADGGGLAVELTSTAFTFGGQSL
jgi:meso-butanediol dehydrogenase / (S,S)-butanediol dehydrogenase / diacetyl reductase